MPELFNVHGFGPPRPFTGTSTWPWVDHVDSGLCPATDVAHFRLAFASAPPRRGLTLPQSNNSPVHYAKGTRSHGRDPKVTVIVLPQLVSIWFQVLLTPLIAVLFTFQSLY